jgi:hypothetical protein
MRARSKELLDRAIAATVSAIEVYNKPDFFYREETFAVLVTTGWELLFKAKWLAENRNQIHSLYVHDTFTKLDGSKGKRQKIKLTRSGNPFTHSLDYLAKKLVETKHLEEVVWRNIQALLEIRDSAIHFYNFGNAFTIRLQEIGVASLRNFATLTKQWFGRDLSEFNFYLMPLSFVTIPSGSAIVLNVEEKNFLRYLDSLDTDTSPEGPFSVAVNIDVRFVKSKARDALDVRITSDPNAPEIRLTEEQIQERYPWTYKDLTSECQKRYSNFSVVRKYHEIRKQMYGNARFCHERRLYPGNPDSTKTQLYNPAILNEFDKHYVKKA